MLFTSVSYFSRNLHKRHLSQACINSGLFGKGLNNYVKENFETLLEKEKMLNSSIFLFSPENCYVQDYDKSGTTSNSIVS